jgi:hypothetical protein
LSSCGEQQNKNRKEEDEKRGEINKKKKEKNQKNRENKIEQHRKNHPSKMCWGAEKQAIDTSQLL